MTNNTAIILAVSVAITILLLFYSARIFLSDKSPSGSASTSGADLSQIENLLKQVLSKSQNVALVADLSGAGKPSAPGSEVLDEIKRLREELKEKQAEINAAKNQSVAIDTVEKSKLESRIKELEAKLSEYEIIAEDIADLSRFKEENVLLKKKIESLEFQPQSLAPSSKPGTSVSSASKVATASESAPRPEVVAAPYVDPQEKPSSQDLVAPAIDDDLMAEFARAVEQQKQKESSPIIKTADLSGGKVGADKGEIDLIGVDLNSIQLEAAGLLEPPAGSEIVNSLEQELNSDRLAAEASTLDQVKPEDIELMNNFEDFVKGR